MASNPKDNITSPTQPTVLDLPQLHKKPSFNTLHSTLSNLAIAPASWDTSLQEDDSTISEAGLPAYLTRIIASPLHWLSAASEQEEIWELASKRLSERSGRSGMSSFERVFRVPTLDRKLGGMQKEGDNGNKGQDEGVKDNGSIDIKIHEPALIGDQLGHKTWLGAYVLAKKLPELLPRYFPRKVTQSVPSGTACFTTNHEYARIRILELGAGTGLTGLAAAAMYPSTTHTHLTDLPYIIPNLKVNVELNKQLLDTENVTVGALDWGQLPEADVGEEERFDVILAADSLYGPEHPGWLTNTMARYLEKGEGNQGFSAKIFTVLPYRTMDHDYHEELRVQMELKGFEILEEGEVIGVEDWHGWRGREEVKCWWCVWGWATATESTMNGGLDEEETERGLQMSSFSAVAEGMDAETTTTDEKRLKALARELALAFPEMLDESY